MRKAMKRMIVFALVFVLAVTGISIRLPEAAAADDQTATWIDVNFTQPMRVKWDWNDLFTDAVTADRSMGLSVAGLVLSQAAEISRANAEAELAKLGFENPHSEYYLLSTDTKNDITQPARTFGHKTITKNGKEYHIICAIFKGTTTLDDAATDAMSIVDGFYLAGKNCEKSLETYVNGISGANKDNTILFITGHSLGASTANEVGLLCDDLVNDSSKFVYTYASPNYKTDAGTAKTSYDNFIRFTNADDLVPLVPPTSDLKHLNHLGRDYYYNLNAMDAAKKQRFERVYKYMKGVTFEDDFIKIKNHMGDTYMSFILSDLTDEEITEYLTPSPTPGATASPTPTADPGSTVTPPAVTLEENPVRVTGKTVRVKSGKKAVLKRNKVLDVQEAEGTLSFIKISGNKKIIINKKTGRVTIKKGLSKKKYKVKVKVTAAGNDVYKKKTVTAAFLIVIR